MAYVPPHKRYADDAKKALVPDSLSPLVEEKINIRSGLMTQGRRNKQGQKIVYAKHSISKWWPFGSTTEDPIPASFHLEPFSYRHVEQKTGETPLVLVRGQASEVEVIEGMMKEPWVGITERILPDLIAMLENVADELKPDACSFKPSLVARFGKILFHGESALSTDSLRKAAGWQGDSRNKVHKIFHTNVPKEFVEHVEYIIPNIGFDFASEKEHYHVKILDKNQPNSTISCKCIILEGGRELEVYKIELNQVRHLVFDISCIYKDLDLRILLYNKRILVHLDDLEKDCINKLIKAAIVDHDVKGGLRWPLGRKSVERFEVVEVWHSTYKAFRGPTVRLRMRKANRFDFRTSLGEATTEVSLKLTKLSEFLEMGSVEADPVKRVLQGNIELIWNHFMSGRSPMTI